MHSCSQSLSEVTFNKECPKMQKSNLFKINFSLFLWFGTQACEWVLYSYSSFGADCNQIPYIFCMKHARSLKCGNDNWAEWRTKVGEMEIFFPIKVWKCSLIFYLCTKLVIYLIHVSNLVQVISRAIRLLSAEHSFSLYCNEVRENKK